MYIPSELETYSHRKTCIQYKTIHNNNFKAKVTQILITDEQVNKIYNIKQFSPKRDKILTNTPRIKLRNTLSESSQTRKPAFYGSVDMNCPE